MSGYLNNAFQSEDHASNVRFQLDNVDGFIQCARKKGDPHYLECARIKCECLIESASKLLAALKEEESNSAKAFMRAMTAPELEAKEEVS